MCQPCLDSLKLQKNTPEKVVGNGKRFFFIWGEKGGKVLLVLGRDYILRSKPLGPLLKVKLLVGYMQNPTKLKGAKGIRVT